MTETAAQPRTHPLHASMQQAADHYVFVKGLVNTSLPWVQYTTYVRNGRGAQALSRSHWGLPTHHSWLSPMYASTYMQMPACV